MTRFLKDPAAVLDYGFDWNDWLADGETISTSTWTVPTGITKDSDSKSDTATIIWLSGGTVDTTYLLTNKIVTSAARTDERSFQILMVQR